MRAWTAGASLWLAICLAPPAHAQQIPVQAGVLVQPDTVRVGDPFTVTVAVRVPRGATIEFPVAADTTGPVQAIASRTIGDGTHSDSGHLEQQAVYRMAAWDVKAQPVLTGDVVVRFAGAERRLSLKGYTVFVASVLPEDTTLRVPKPARALFESRMIPWWVWAILAAALALAWAIWYWWRHRERHVLVEYLDPYVRATRAFARIEALGLLEAGERGRYVALTVEVLRAYLAECFPSAPLSTTSTELLAATRDQQTVLQERLLRVLNEADLIKFAQRSVSTERARELGKEARFLVDHEHKASQAAIDAAARLATTRQTGAAA